MTAVELLSRLARQLTKNSPPPDSATPLRWAIDTAATPGRWGDAWGDTHFAVSLARALGRLGQIVQIDRRNTRDRASRREDDVVLTLRGLEQVAPQPGPLNLLWVISHPEDVTGAEASSYDQVFAASPQWALARSAEWDLPITPLLQCTDVEFFHPGRTLTTAGEDVVFIGNARRGFRRPVVEWTVEAGADLHLYGTGWEQTPVASHLVATEVPNDEVGAHYATARIVLNDHWDDMRRAGFISNRLFDAVACGARVLSDPIDGAADLFDGCVVSCDSAEEVRTVLAADPDEVWPDRDRRVAVAERIATEHSFDRRAEVLLDHALRALGR